MERRLAIALSLVGIAALGGPSLADAGSSGDVKTKATMGLSYFPESESRNYDVFVSAPKDKCVEGRAVSVFQKLPGKDNRIGKATSNEFGGAFVTDSPAEPFVEGDQFYAKVKKRILGNTTCLSAKTKTSTIGPG
ncbi:MAG: hypothetical protein QOI31_450 [Solirubrobacterales bacterium]|jgi:hypothetical protein|nr:hypothetical protein [Solirubrobacterales bacterium]